MFISRFKNWLEEVDPYTIQRGALHKALFIAIVITYVYWFFLPVNYLSFILPFFIVSLYETPILSSFKKKEQLLLFSSLAVTFVSVSFYLVYPFRGTFFFFSLFVLAGLYFLVLRYFYALKSLVMLVLSTGTIVLGTEPEANLQIAYGIISSVALSSITVMICLKVFPNQYLRVWNKALQGFIKYFEEDIENALLENNRRFIKEPIIHFEMVRNYQRLVGKKYLLSSYRVAVYIRNIQISLDNLYYEQKTEIFWRSVKTNLNHLRLNMDSYTPCPPPKIDFPPQTKLQHYIVDCLNRAFAHWNNLCRLRHS
ncbi:hypothetical protein BN59_01427 [Legionella massiliensis]|uniref:Inner membrane protein YeeA n=1 Tax=Legionella massiliensis TaxID=1034943 RepID=A0A078KRT2_9GAMM|nr:hypothetical protein [Legionella massiliensis]CDZ77145.1 hypothetical protein BN59_01427 [Legionella massiliensis]CEE12883.1 hypothetical protein BN1094_01427 [Legionella massiliensis]